MDGTTAFVLAKILGGGGGGVSPEEFNEFKEQTEDDIEDLNDRCDNLENIGRFLALWDATTGLPTTEPFSTPYEYKTGDYYRIGRYATPAPAGTFKFDFTKAGGSTKWLEVTLPGTPTITCLSDLCRWLYDNNYRSASSIFTGVTGLFVHPSKGNLNVTGLRCDRSSAASGEDALYICWENGEIGKSFPLNSDDNHSLVASTNYRPTGSSYTGAASTTEETEDIDETSIYFYDGTQWVLQASGGGGSVNDVQVDGESKLSGGIASFTSKTLTFIKDDGTTEDLKFVLG